MHITLLLSGLAGGGAQRRMLTLARDFAEIGHHVDVVAVRAEGPFRAELSPALRLVALEPRFARLPGVESRRALFVPAAVPRLAAYLRRERPNVLLSTSSPANFAAVAARALARVGTPVVLSVNVHLSAAIEARPRLGRWLPRLVARSVLRRADAVIAISNGVAEDLVEHFGVPPAHTTAIYNPLAADALQARARETPDHPWLAPGGAPVVLAVGKLKRQKDFPTLLRAFARVRRARPARLVILGEGEERPRLLRLARELGVEADVDLPGFVENPFAWMARASVLAHSSRWEGFSNVLGEALACGCPVVSTDCPSGPAEILAAGAFGSLVPVGDDRALAEAILGALEKPIAAERLRARAACFSIAAAVDAYLEVLLRVCGKASGVEQAPTLPGGLRNVC